MRLELPPLPTVRLPGRNGLVFMGGMAALAGFGMVSAPVAVALAVLPVIDANVSAGEGGGRPASAARRAPVTAGAASRRRSTGGAPRKPRAATSPPTPARRAPRRRTAPAATE